MALKWLALFVGGGLILPQLSLGDEGLMIEKAPQAIFHPVPEGEGFEIDLSQQKQTAHEVFGLPKGYAHPFLSVGGYYTSNLFNTGFNEDSDTVAVVSPGIWFAIPGSRQPLLQVETLNVSPGGLEVGRFRTVADRRFQGYALYVGEFNEHDKFSEANTEDHRAEILLQYNFRGGLSVELVNVFEDDHDTFSTGTSGVGQLDKFQKNILNPTISYQMTPKLRFEANYAWHVLDYDATRNDFRDREDQAFSGYIFYKFGAKTSVFADYEYIQVDYDEKSQVDSDEQRLFGGIQWKATDKSKGRIKLGYGKKDFDAAGIDDRNFFTAEAKLDHKFSKNVSSYLKAYRKAGETDIEGTRDFLTHRVVLGYTHKLGGKLTGKLKGYYYRDSYDGEITEGGKTGERKDQNYGGEIGFGYAFTRWLNVSLGYSYTERDSNFNNRDYRDYTAIFKLTAAL